MYFDENPDQELNGSGATFSFLLLDSRTLQEMNSRNILQSRDSLVEAVKLLTTLPTATDVSSNSNETYRLPFMCTELMCVSNSPFANAFLQDSNIDLFDEIWNFPCTSAAHNPVLLGYFTRVASSLFAAQPEKCSAWLRTRSSRVRPDASNHSPLRESLRESLLNHVSHRGILELLTCLYCVNDERFISLPVAGLGRSIGAIFAKLAKDEEIVLRRRQRHGRRRYKRRATAAKVLHDRLVEASRLDEEEFAKKCEKEKENKAEENNEQKASEPLDQSSSAKETNANNIPHISQKKKKNENNPHLSALIESLTESTFYADVGETTDEEEDLPPKDANDAEGLELRGFAARLETADNVRTFVIDVLNCAFRTEPRYFQTLYDEFTHPMSVALVVSVIGSSSQHIASCAARYLMTLATDAANRIGMNLTVDSGVENFLTQHASARAATKIMTSLKKRIIRCRLPTDQTIEVARAEAGELERDSLVALASFAPLGVVIEGGRFDENLMQDEFWHSSSNDNLHLSNNHNSNNINILSRSGDNNIETDLDVLVRDGDGGTQALNEEDEDQLEAGVDYRKFVSMQRGQQSSSLHEDDNADGHGGDANSFTGKLFAPGFVPTALRDQRRPEDAENDEDEDSLDRLGGHIAPVRQWNSTSLKGNKHNLNRDENSTMDLEHLNTNEQINSNSAVKTPERRRHSNNITNLLGDNNQIESNDNEEFESSSPLNKSHEIQNAFQNSLNKSILRYYEDEEENDDEDEENSNRKSQKKFGTLPALASFPLKDLSREDTMPISLNSPLNNDNNLGTDNFANEDDAEYENHHPPTIDSECIDSFTNQKHIFQYDPSHGARRRRGGGGARPTAAVPQVSSKSSASSTSSSSSSHGPLSSSDDEMQLKNGNRIGILPPTVIPPPLEDIVNPHVATSIPLPPRANSSKSPSHTHSPSPPVRVSPTLSPSAPPPEIESAIHHVSLENRTPADLDNLLIARVPPTCTNCNVIIFDTLPPHVCGPPSSSRFLSAQFLHHSVGAMSMHSSRSSHHSAHSGFLPGPGPLNAILSRLSFSSGGSVRSDVSVRSSGSVDFGQSPPRSPKVYASNNTSSSSAASNNNNTANITVHINNPQSQQYTHHNKGNNNNNNNNTLSPVASPMAHPSSPPRPSSTTPSQRLRSVTTANSPTTHQKTSSLQTFPITSPPLQSTPLPTGGDLPSQSSDSESNSTSNSSTPPPLFLPSAVQHAPPSLRTHSVSSTSSYSMDKDSHPESSHQQQQLQSYQQEKTAESIQSSSNINNAPNNHHNHHNLSTHHHQHHSRPALVPAITQHSEVATAHASMLQGTPTNKPHLESLAGGHPSSSLRPTPLGAHNKVSPSASTERSASIVSSTASPIRHISLQSKTSNFEDIGDVKHQKRLPSCSAELAKDWYGSDYGSDDEFDRISLTFSEISQTNEALPLEGMIARFLYISAPIIVVAATKLLHLHAERIGVLSEFTYKTNLIVNDIEHKNALLKIRQQRLNDESRMAIVKAVHDFHPDLSAKFGPHRLPPGYILTAKGAVPEVGRGIYEILQLLGTLAHCRQYAICDALQSAETASVVLDYILGAGWSNLAHMGCWTVLTEMLQCPSCGTPAMKSLVKQEFIDRSNVIIKNHKEGISWSTPRPAASSGVFEKLKSIIEDEIQEQEAFSQLMYEGRENISLLALFKTESMIFTRARAVSSTGRKRATILWEQRNLTGQVSILAELIRTRHREDYDSAYIEAADSLQQSPAWPEVRAFLEQWISIADQFLVEPPQSMLAKMQQLEQQHQQDSFGSSKNSLEQVGAQEELEEQLHNESDDHYRTNNDEDEFYNSFADTLGGRTDQSDSDDDEGNQHNFENQHENQNHHEE